MNNFITHNNGGLPLVLDDVRWFLGQLDSDSTVDSSGAGIYQALNNLLRTFGDNFIVQGCVFSSPAMTEGWIMLDGELLKVDANADIGANTHFSKVTTYDSAGNKTFQNATSIDTYAKYRGVVNAGSGNLEYNGDTILDVVKEGIELQRDVVEVTTASYNLLDNDYIIILNASLLYQTDIVFSNPSGSAVREVYLIVKAGLGSFFFKDYLGVTKVTASLGYVYKAICNGTKWYVFNISTGYTEF